MFQVQTETNRKGELHFSNRLCGNFSFISRDGHEINPRSIKLGKRGLERLQGGNTERAETSTVDNDEFGSTIFRFEFDVATDNIRDDEIWELRTWEKSVVSHRCETKHVTGERFYANPDLGNCMVHYINDGDEVLGREEHNKII